MFEVRHAAWTEVAVFGQIQMEEQSEVQVTERIKQAYKGKGQGERPWHRQPWRRGREIRREKQEDRIRNRQASRQVCVPELGRDGKEIEV